MTTPTGSLFLDGKAPDALRTIGEVASALGIRQHVLRYWEEQFPMLRPLKRSGGRRYYRPEDVSLIVQIDRLVHRQGYTLRGARLALEDKGTLADLSPPPAPASDAQKVPGGMDAHSQSGGACETGERLRQIRDRLAAALH